ncbi:hypothetical protein MKQ70_36395 [Chitinophaga sedimenti]|uniref:methyltransferase n=1 Tax=Chitinophaga sedimenti TaxID=2033606 RepID=UPI002006236C|nr:methyltransferase [Chitinophaga sedimenti]MCK7560108.1 hypothetical protein [Chitinophaga sedimenti]
MACVAYDPEVQITIFDLPGQVARATKNITEAGYIDRVSFHVNNILDESIPFPKDFDAIWMSQFWTVSPKRRSFLSSAAAARH